MTSAESANKSANKSTSTRKSKKSVDTISVTSDASSGNSIKTGETLNNEMYCKTCDPKCKYFDCICAESWKSFDETLGKIKKVSSEILLESLRISTITLCFNLNSNIDIENISKTYISKNNGKFYNSLIFNWHTKYQYKTVVSVKIFPNGKVQVAGLSNIKSCAYIIRKVYRKCEDYFETPETATISDVRIAMINSDFKINNIINLTQLCEELSHNSVQSGGNYLSIVYQPIKYPAVNCKFICNRNLLKYYEHIYKHSYKKKFTDTVSILIFRSGSIIITGGNNIDDYLNIYQILLTTININFKNLSISK
jgi:TATA-box binding protein (TBP) (component of TFIID and TFIIIB)